MTYAAVAALVISLHDHARQLEADEANVRAVAVGWQLRLVADAVSALGSAERLPPGLLRPDALRTILNADRLYRQAMSDLESNPDEAAQAMAGQLAADSKEKAAQATRAWTAWLEAAL